MSCTFMCDGHENHGESQYLNEESQTLIYYGSAGKLGWNGQYSNNDLDLEKLMKPYKPTQALIRSYLPTGVNIESFETEIRTYNGDFENYGCYYWYVEVTYTDSSEGGSLANA